MTPIQKGGKNENGRVAAPDIVPIYLKVPKKQMTALTDGNFFKKMFHPGYIKMKIQRHRANSIDPDEVSHYENSAVFIFSAEGLAFCRVAMVREKYQENEIFSRSGKSQRNCGWSRKFRKDLENQGKVREFENKWLWQADFR